VKNTNFFNDFRDETLKNLSDRHFPRTSTKEENSTYKFIINYTWTECAKLKDEEWRKVVEPLVLKINEAIDENTCSDNCSSINYQGFRKCDCYKHTLRKALEDYEKKVVK
jgi:hypothetical protein